MTYPQKQLNSYFYDKVEQGNLYGNTIYQNQLNTAVSPGFGYGYGF